MLVVDIMVNITGSTREFGRSDSAWWYNGGGGWGDERGWNGRNEGGVRVLFLRRASRDWIISVSKQILANIDYKGAEGRVEGDGCLVGL